MGGPAAECRNVGTWPVLVGEDGARDTMLSSPIILYDYPRIAPESAGDLFDGTEIDEILSLRIMTLTDDEKREIRQTDERARLLLERTESLDAEQMMRLHGTSGAAGGGGPAVNEQLWRELIAERPVEEPGSRAGRSARGTGSACAPAPGATSSTSRSTARPPRSNRSSRTWRGTSWCPSWWRTIPAATSA